LAIFLNKVTGQTVERPAHYAKHPVLGKNLQLIEGDVAKAPVFVPEVRVAQTPVEPVIEIEVQQEIVLAEEAPAEAPETSIEE
jgi:hypothetical protein